MAATLRSVLHSCLPRIEAAKSIASGSTLPLKSEIELRMYQSHTTGLPMPVWHDLRRTLLDMSVAQRKALDPAAFDVSSYKRDSEPLLVATFLQNTGSNQKFTSRINMPRCGEWLYDRKLLVHREPNTNVLGKLCTADLVISIEGPGATKEGGREAMLAAFVDRAKSLDAPVTLHAKHRTSFAITDGVSLMPLVSVDMTVRQILCQKPAATLEVCLRQLLVQCCADVEFEKWNTQWSTSFTANVRCDVEIELLEHTDAAVTLADNVISWLRRTMKAIRDPVTGVESLAGDGLTLLGLTQIVKDTLLSTVLQKAMQTPLRHIVDASFGAMASETGVSKPGEAFLEGARFPGTLPCAMTRESLSAVHKNPQNYLAGAKLDGTRYLMLIVRYPDSDGGSSSNSNKRMKPNASTRTHYLVLQDRGMRFYAEDSIAQLYRTQKSGGLVVQCILDVELVTCHKTSVSSFVVFDCLYRLFDGDTAAAPNVAAMHIRDRLLHAKEALHSLANDWVYDVVSKPVYEIGKMEEPQNIPARGLVLHQRVYDYNKRQWPIDGWLLAPTDRPYHVAVDQHILKWKWNDRSTCDFCIKLERDVDYCEILDADSIAAGGVVIGLYARSATIGASSSHLAVCTRIIVDRHLFDRIAHECNEVIGTEQPSRNVTEWCFDTHKGTWEYVKVRSDKTQPNPVSVVTQTLQVLCRPIGLLELFDTSATRTK